MDIKTTIAMLFTAYTHGEQNDQCIALYVTMLSDIPPAGLRAVVMQCIAECKFVPTIAEIRERWVSMTTAQQITQPEEAWTEVKRAILRHGHAGTPEFSDPMIQRVVDALGWRELCLSENQIADRAHFLKIYGSFAERAADDLRLLPTSRNLISRHTGRNKQITTRHRAAQIEDRSHETD